MWYRHIEGPNKSDKWIRIKRLEFINNPLLLEQRYEGIIEVKYPPCTPKQISQWNRFKTLGDLSRTLAGMQEIVRNPLIKLTLEERQLHRVYVNTLKIALERVRQDKSI